MMAQIRACIEYLIPTDIILILLSHLISHIDKSNLFHDLMIILKWLLFGATCIGIVHCHNC